MIAVRTLSAIISLYGCFLLHMLSALRGDSKATVPRKIWSEFFEGKNVTV